MRKSDYAALAHALASEVFHARQTTDLPREACARRIAESFALRANIDKQAFMRACGF